MLISMEEDIKPKNSLNIFEMDKRRDLINPRANLVVVKEPKIDPTPPREFKITGYMIRMAGSLANSFENVERKTPLTTPPKLVITTKGEDSLIIDLKTMFSKSSLK